MSDGTTPPVAAQQIFPVRGRPLLDELQLEHAGRPDDFLRAVDVGHAGELHENLIGALLRDARLGHPQLVHAALDRLARLHDGLFAQRLRDVRTHAERVAAVGARTAFEVDRQRFGGLSKGPVLRRRHAVDAKRLHVLNGHRGRHIAPLQLFLKTGAVLLGRHAQRVVGLHAKHEVHAALQVEPKLQLAVAQPLRCGQVVARRKDRIDADPEEHGEDGSDEGDFPA